MAKLHVNVPGRPKDSLLEVPGYGLFKNRHIYEVEKLDEDLVVGGGEELDHKTVLKDPNVRNRREPQEHTMQSADEVDQGVPQTDPSTPKADGDNKDGA